jgi:hypothetical protein
MLNWIDIKPPHFARCYKLSDWTLFSLLNVVSGDSLSLKSGQHVILFFLHNYVVMMEYTISLPGWFFTTNICNDPLE